MKLVLMIMEIFDRRKRMTRFCLHLRIRLYQNRRSGTWKFQVYFPPLRPVWFWNFFGTSSPITPLSLDSRRFCHERLPLLTHIWPNISFQFLDTFVMSTSLSWLASVAKFFNFFLTLFSWAPLSLDSFMAPVFLADFSFLKCLGEISLLWLEWQLWERLWWQFKGLPGCFDGCLADLKADLKASLEMSLKAVSRSTALHECH